VNQSRPFWLPVTHPDSDLSEKFHTSQYSGALRY
jgi:hypothetical protein